MHEADAAPLPPGDEPVHPGSTGPRRADRPHWITIVLTIGALGASGFSAWLSYRALTMNLQFNAMAQQAYLTIRNFQTSTSEEAVSGGGKRILLKVTAELFNGGNTPADNTVVKQTVYFESAGAADAQSFKEDIGFIAPRDADTLRIAVVLPASYVTATKQLRGTVKIRGHAVFKTRVENEEHFLDWCRAYSLAEGFKLCPYGDYAVR
jgi:hypothetical protein